VKATKAYIASLGTTGVLLAASVLMLAVVSAVVAFDRWPDGNVTSRVQTLVLAENPAPIRVSDRATGPSLTRTPRAAALARAIRAAGRAPTVAGRRFSGGRLAPVAGPSPSRPAIPAVPALPGAPKLPDPQTLPDVISNPGTTAGTVADGAQTVTDAAGVSVGKISPDLGNAVAGTGQLVAQTVRQLPLPNHILPGH
jgi:hypothetical protein